MITLRKSEERGATKIDWLDSKHSFSFGDYYDPAHVKLRPAARHQRGLDRGRRRLSRRIRHRDMEIVTYLIDGALQHKDSIGGGGVIRPGEIQRMSAGCGIVHSEFNASNRSARRICCRSGSCRRKTVIEPSYEQKAIDPETIRNKFARIAAPDPNANEVRLVQDAEIWAARLDKDVEAIHPLAAGRRAWLQIVSGELMLGERDSQSRRRGGDHRCGSDQAARDRAERSSALRYGLGRQAEPALVAGVDRRTAGNR